jgi:metallo-beta-lactamase family protein
VHATIVHMGDYSGHADVDDIMRFLKGFDSKPRKMFLVHGEEEALVGLQEHIKKTLGWDVEVPRLRQQFVLD